MSAIPTKIIGFSPTPTRYRITTSTGDIFVRCGADLLLNGLRSDLAADGRCPVCNQSIKFKVAERRVMDMMPRSTRLHIVEMSYPTGRIGICCEDTHLFDREECERQWLSEYRGQPGISTTPQEYLERLKTKLQKETL